MGKPMAVRLVRAGFPVVVHNRSPQAVEALAGEGAETASSPREIAEGPDVVVTMLPDSPDVEAVVLGDDGVIAAVREGMLLVDMSTIAPATARQVHAALAERGVEAVDAPVSGGSQRRSTGSSRSWPGAATGPSSGQVRSSGSSAR
jgi:2-hydroxy-3-oxopropionate reductase